MTTALLLAATLLGVDYDLANPNYDLLNVPAIQYEVMLAPRPRVVLPQKIVRVPLTEYEAAYQRHIQTGQPLVVMIGAKWCDSCNLLKPRFNTLRLPHAYFDYDTDKVMVKAVTGNKVPSMIPFIRVYHTKPTVAVYEYTAEEAFTWVDSQLGSERLPNK